MYAPQNPEEKMEKYRFYCELPGDFWEARYVASASCLLRGHHPHSLSCQRQQCTATKSLWYSTPLQSCSQL